MAHSKMNSDRECESTKKPETQIFLFSDSTCRDITLNFEPHVQYFIFAQGGDRLGYALVRRVQKQIEECRSRRAKRFIIGLLMGGNNLFNRKGRADMKEEEFVQRYEAILHAIMKLEYIPVNTVFVVFSPLPRHCEDCTTFLADVVDTLQHRLENTLFARELYFMNLMPGFARRLDDGGFQMRRELYRREEKDGLVHVGYRGNQVLTDMIQEGFRYWLNILEEQDVQPTRSRSPVFTISEFPEDRWDDDNWDSVSTTEPRQSDYVTVIQTPPEAQPPKEASTVESTAEEKPTEAIHSAAPVEEPPTEEMMLLNQIQLYSRQLQAHLVVAEATRLHLNSLILQFSNLVTRQYSTIVSQARQELGIVGNLTAVQSMHEAKHIPTPSKVVAGFIAERLDNEKNETSDERSSQGKQLNALAPRFFLPDKGSK